MRIATFNVNSIKVRLPLLLGWLKQAAPDVVLLQEIKVETEKFPRTDIEDAGYNLAVVGQKTYNGVAILSKFPMTVELDCLPGSPGGEEQSRYVEAVVDAGAHAVRVASIYLPNGNPVETEKFPYKLGWMERLRAHAATLLRHEEILVLGGDYNCCPTDLDVYDPVGWANDALCRPETRQHFRALCNLGFTDAVRALDPSPHLYTFWDYQAGRWQRDQGLRIDHLLLSPQAADRLMAAGVDKTPRGFDRPSDHTPAWVELAV
ncbi:exodeoxyribonuclease III [Zavarzinia sp. CC-PAN008]|uniref:exodeoxyribonuclease III n=1 Tax=Zavarzinia sp. CC-PAN008 TaxID=3243332 RepID=UPI003F74AA11